MKNLKSKAGSIYNRLVYIWDKLPRNYQTTIIVTAIVLGFFVFGKAVIILFFGGVSNLFPVIEGFVFINIVGFFLRLLVYGVVGVIAAAVVAFVYYASIEIYKWVGRVTKTIKVINKQYDEEI